MQSLQCPLEKIHPASEFSRGRLLYLCAQARVVVAWMAQLTVDMVNQERPQEGDRFETLRLLATLMCLAVQQ